MQYLSIQFKNVLNGFCHPIGILVLQHLHSVAPRFALGFEVASQYGRNIPGGVMNFVSLAGRYSGPEYTFSAIGGKLLNIRVVGGVRTIFILGFFIYIKRKKKT